MISINAKKNKAKRQGAALLVVLFVLMAITILSLGFLSRSNVELACGQNMVLRAKMDYLAESGLQHAKGLILNPQDIEQEYWSGAASQQLAAGNDYYDVVVVRDDSVPTDRCNYIIDCNAYQLKGVEEVGRSSLSAELRLDPCIALWMGKSATVWDGVTVNGDVYCNGTLKNYGIIDGDVFADSLSGSISGRHKAVADLSLNWPNVTVDDFKDKPGVNYQSGSYALNGNESINGMLLVDGDLKVSGINNVIVAGKNLPALYVTGDLILEKGAVLDVNGLVVVDMRSLINGDAGLNVLGGLFNQDVFAETTQDSSGNGNTGVLYNGPTWQFVSGHSGLRFDGEDDYVGTGKTLLSGMSEFTLSGWISAGNPQESRIGLFGQNDSIEFGFDSGNIRIWTLNGGSASKSWSFQNFTWHHVAAVGDGNDLKIYIDGQESAIGGSGTVNYGSSNYGFNIGGCIWDPTGNWFDGFIDDVRIYNSALDPNDIYPPKGGLPGLVGHWKLDESGSTVTITAAPAKTAIVTWSEEGNQEKWGQAAGAFFRSIQRR